MPLPPFVNIGGPIDTGISLLRNQDPFTQKPIVRNGIPEEQMAKDLSLYIYRQLGPNAPYIPGSYSWDKIEKAYRGVTDELGRAYDLPTAALSTVGVKVEPFDPEVKRVRKIRELKRDLDDATSALRTAAYRRKSNAITVEQYQKILRDQSGIVRDLTGRIREVNKIAESLRK